MSTCVRMICWVHVSVAMLATVDRCAASLSLLLGGLRCRRVTDLVLSVCVQIGVYLANDCLNCGVLVRVRHCCLNRSGIRVSMGFGEHKNRSLNSVHRSTLPQAEDSRSRCTSTVCICAQLKRGIIDARCGGQAMRGRIMKQAAG